MGQAFFHLKKSAFFTYFTYFTYLTKNDKFV